MPTRVCLILFLVLSISVPGFPQSATAIPDTPAGRVFREWIEAFNSGEREQLDAYYKTHEPGRMAEAMMPFRAETGGFELLEIRKSDPFYLEVVVKERNSPTVAIGRLTLKDGEPTVVTSFPLRAIPPGASLSQVDFTIDNATRARVIDGAVAKLNELYVFPETAKKMEEAVRERKERGEYDSVTDGDRFAALLTTHFREVSNDRHLSVTFSPTPLPGLNPNAAAQYRERMERINCGFEKVELLDDNVGYLKFNVFASPDMCAPTATAAMNFLGNVDALIVDLRENGGGDPKMIAYVSTYLFSEPTHLNDIWERKGGKTDEYWTLKDVPGKRLAGKPVYVLTARRTFSGAEEFSYNLKNLKRATIIGETTGGGAHPVAGQQIDARFTIGVPFARAINPITKTNWEGVGVEPDVSVPAAEALATAQKLATEKLRSK